jgi:hypothetical protein
MNLLLVDNPWFSVDNLIVLWITRVRIPLISSYKPQLADYPQSPASLHFCPQLPVDTYTAHLRYICNSVDDQPPQLRTVNLNHQVLPNFYLSTTTTIT